MKKLIFNILPIVLILLLAAVLRLYRINEYMTFLGDEGRDVLVVKRMIVDRKFTLLGPITSVGSIYMGPIYYYLMIPFLWAWGMDPVGPSIMVALFAVATVALIYKFCREFINPYAGIISAFLYATSPLTIIYGRSSWNPNVVPFFGLAVLYGIAKTVVKRQFRWLATSGLALGVLLQLHYVTLLFIPVIAACLALIRFKIPRKYYFYAALTFLLTYSPFLLFELRHQFVNIQGAIRFINQQKQESGISLLIAVNVIYDVVVRLFWRLIVIQSAEITKLFILFIISALVIFWKGCKKAEQSNKNALLVILLWMGIGIISFGLYQGIIYDYYFGSLFPAPFILTGVSLVTVWKKGNTGKAASAILLILLIYFHYLQSPLRMEPNNLLRNTRNISEFVLEKTGGNPYNFALIAGKNSDHAYRYFLEIRNHPPVVIENPAVDPDRKTVMNQLLVVCEEKECKPLGHPLWEIAGFGQAEITGEWQISTARVFKLVHLRDIKRSKI